MVVAEQGSGNYAQIGHGGYRQAVSLHGDVSVVAHGATTALDGRGSPVPAFNFEVAMAPAATRRLVMAPQVISIVGPSGISK